MPSLTLWSLQAAPNTAPWLIHRLAATTLMRWFSTSCNSKENADQVTVLHRVLQLNIDTRKWTHVQNHCWRGALLSYDWIPVMLAAGLAAYVTSHTGQRASAFQVSVSRIDFLYQPTTVETCSEYEYQLGIHTNVLILKFSVIFSRSSWQIDVSKGS